MATGLFLFDNAPSHQKRAADALSACRMSKVLCAKWTHHKNGLKMQNAIFANGDPQPLYYPDNHPTPRWFKGMETLIHEQGLWPETRLNAQCLGFKCEAGAQHCCCHCVLLIQLDFCAQKSELEGYITSRGHICDFYPRFHCELNFIE